MSNLSRGTLAYLTLGLLVVWTACPVRAEIIARYGQCYLENMDGLLVLHLKGTPSEMGYAHGYLLADKVRRVYQALGGVLDHELDAQKQKEVAAAARPFIPERYIEEIHAIAAGANAALRETAVDPDRLLELHSWDEIVREGEHAIVAHFAALGAGTQDGHVILGLNRDDEQAVRRGVQDGAVVTIYEPQEGHTFCSVGWAGFVGVMTGINSQGVVVSEASFPAYGQRTEGLPLPFQLRLVLEQAAGVQSAENLMRSLPRTVTGNVLVADGGDASAVRAFEFSADRFEVFTEADPREDHTYVVRDEGITFRVTYFDDPIELSLPSGHGNIAAVLSQPLANAIVRSGVFVHHQGEPGSANPPLLELQCNWVMELGVRRPDFDFVDVSALLPATYPYRSLDIAFLIDKIVSKKAREIVSPILAALLDVVVPGWDAELYRPHFAALSRSSTMRRRISQRLGQIDPTQVIWILGGDQPTPAFNTLIEPNTLHSAVFDATTLEVWVASAPPKGSAGKPDANLQTYRYLPFGSYATYPLSIRTEPVAGEVFVNGTRWGTAPRSRRVLPGQYVVSFGQVAGYRSPPDQTVQVGLNGAMVTGTYIPTHRLTITIDGQGTVEPAGGVYDEGTRLNLRANPAAGHHFVAWSGGYTGTNPTADIVLMTDLTVTAHFAPNPPAHHALTVTRQGQGTVVPSSGLYPAGSEVSVTATPADGWIFVRWMGDASSTNASIRIVMDRDKNVTAVFEQLFNLSIEVEGVGEVLLDPPGGAYPPGTVVKLAAQGQGLLLTWRFLEWRGDVQSQDNPLYLTMDGNKHLVAVFTTGTPPEPDPNNTDPNGTHSNGGAPPCMVMAATAWTATVLIAGVLVGPRPGPPGQRRRRR